MCFILSHGAALETASCDLSTLSASNGNERTQTGGALKQRKAIKLGEDLFAVAYVCESCGTEIKRTIREK